MRRSGRRAAASAASTKGNASTAGRSPPNREQRALHRQDEHKRSEKERIARESKARKDKKRKDEEAAKAAALTTGNDAVPKSDDDAVPKSDVFLPSKRPAALPASAADIPSKKKPLAMFVAGECDDLPSSLLC